MPEAALEQLRHLPVSRRERRTYLALTREPPSTALGQRLAVFNGYWLEKTGAIPRWRQVYEFPGHLQDQFGLAHAWEIPIELTARFAREVRQLGRSHRDGRE